VVNYFFTTEVTQVNRGFLFFAVYQVVTAFYNTGD